jgi:hypothetical protein
MVDGFLRGEPFSQELKPIRSVARVRVGLRRNRADVRLGPGDDGSDREKFRLDGDAPLIRVEVRCDD